MTAPDFARPSPFVSFVSFVVPTAFFRFMPADSVGPSRCDEHSAAETYNDLHPVYALRARRDTRDFSGGTGRRRSGGQSRVGQGNLGQGNGDGRGWPSVAPYIPCGGYRIGMAERGCGVIFPRKKPEPRGSGSASRRAGRNAHAASDILSRRLILFRSLRSAIS